jgi:hypothetical protein
LYAKPNPKTGIKAMRSDKWLEYHHNGILKYDSGWGGTFSILLSPFDFQPPEKKSVHPDKPKGLKPGEIPTVKKLVNAYWFLDNVPMFYKYLYCLKRGAPLHIKKQINEKNILSMLELVKGIWKEELTTETKLDLMRDIVKTNTIGTKGAEEWSRFETYDDLQCNLVQTLNYRLGFGYIRVEKDTAEYYGFFCEEEGWNFKHDKKFMVKILNPTRTQLSNLENAAGRQGIREMKRTQINFDTIQEFFTQFKDMFKDYDNKKDIYTVLKKLGLDVNEYLEEKRGVTNE